MVRLVLHDLVGSTRAAPPPAACAAFFRVAHLGSLEIEVAVPVVVACGNATASGLERGRLSGRRPDDSLPALRLLVVVLLLWLLAPQVVRWRRARFPGSACGCPDSVSELIGAFLDLGQLAAPQPAARTTCRHAMQCGRLLRFHSPACACSPGNTSAMLSISAPASAAPR